ncbi:four-carbon acid sugar kinase family protein [Chloroflexota bacterium]
MNLNELLADQPPVNHIPDARRTIKRHLLNSGKRLVVIDDDPTGPQAIHDVRVFMDWSVDTLRKAFRTGDPVLFICTNSRSLSPGEAVKVSLEAGEHLREAAEVEKAEVLLTSRSDSTLRGHFPGEPDALISGLGTRPDGIILVPAFFEGGRYTVGDVHYAEQNGEMVPVHLTEFARDPAYSYKNSDLKKWVEEKTGGSVQAKDVHSISLKIIRNGGPKAVTEELMQTSGMTVFIANAACYEDLEVLALGITEAEGKGKRFAYRCSASFIKARGGFDDKPLLTYKELFPENAPGLIVAGSYVDKTSRQLKRLLASGLAEGIELHVEELERDESAEREIKAATDYVNQLLAEAKNTVIYTSREMLASPERDFAETGRHIMQSLCRIVRNIDIKPGWIIAKGGITSIELAKSTLDAREAFAIGQILPGVPVWRLLDDARWTNIPYVVFPGNVGDEDALLNAVKILLGKNP